MSKQYNISTRLFLIVGLSSLFFAGYSIKNKEIGHKVFVEEPEDLVVPELIDSPDITLQYPYNNSNGQFRTRSSLIGLKDPLNVKRTTRYNAKTGRYEFVTTLGDSNNLSWPSSMSLEEYRKYQEQKAQEDYWKEKIADDNSTNTGSFVPKLDETNREFGDICEGKLIEINPQGSAELRFGLNTTRTDNPAIPVKQRQLTTFDFDQQIQLNVQGSICDKFNLNFNYNTEATFDFENQTKLAYEGNEDQILQKIEAGNVTFPIQNSLIQGSQSLFGLRTDLKFGKLNISSVVSQNRGERKEINIKNGAQQKEYELPINNYEANRHYFLNHYHRDNYDKAMNSLPNVSSQVRITKIEVWVTNRVNDFDDTRNIVAFSDLGETKILEGNPQGITNTNSVPFNGANGLYGFLSNTPGARNLTTVTSTLNGVTGAPGPLVQSKHYEKLENARLLSVSEYNYNSILGYISLNQPLNNDEILGVSYQYTYQGKTYQVGEFSTDGIKGNDALFVKMLKGTVNSPQNKVWDLMMKNIYSIGAYQINQENFKLDVWYNNPKTGVEINYIPQSGVDDKLVLQLIGGDIINQQQQPYSDGVFDFIPLQYNGNRVENGGTINPQNGRIIFSKVEPFGSYLEEKLKIAGVPQTIINTIAYTQLYDSTQTIALQFPELNRFKIKGTYESANSSEISLNAFNIPQGSVTVTAGGVQLVENQDYTVDYNIGRVKILNDGVLNSGTPIKISLESNSLFTSIQKTMIGTHFDYQFNKNFNLGATMLRLSEKPMTQKVNLGDEPVRNTMLGINGNFRRDVPLLTKLVDKIPFINTKEKSSVTASMEAAYLIPGHNPAIGDEGQSFIDDFEGSQSAIDIRSFNTWVIASVPQGQPDLFPEASLINNVNYGKNRALINWNVYDPSVFYEERGLVPSYVESDPIQHNHTMRLVQESELFPNRSIDPTAGQIDRIAMFNLAYFPAERGPYNYDTDPTTVSRGLANDGTLNDPSSRWGGIMRQLQTNDFENANIEYIQFWVMEPFNSVGGGDNDDSPNSTGGELYINLGNVSEDILRDGVKTFENGLPTDGVFDGAILTLTNWGRVPTLQQIITAFDNTPASRVFQDVGLDGLSNNQEQAFFTDYINWVNASPLSPAAKTALRNDPSGDDYTFYRNDQYDSQTANIIDRYKRFNGLEGNSATDEQSQNLNGAGYPTSKTTLPDLEDINRDNNLNETESYYQYKINIKPGEMEVGKNYIVDKVVRIHKASGKQVTWYQYRVPVREPNKVVNGIQDFRSIRFMRIFMKEFQEPVILRFARLELLRGTWRRYDKDIVDDGEYIQSDPSGTIFNISAVNIEENSERDPINYTLPPNFQREINPNSAIQAYLNEQSLEMELCGLKDGVAKAAFRSVDFDVLNYKKIKMFVHGEQHTSTNDPVQDDDVTIFVRIGTDFQYNYYEYEMPIKMTAYGAVSESDVWPEANNLEIILQDLKNLKVARNNSLGVNASILSIFEQTVPGKPEHIIKVIGNPNLRDLKTIMIGVRNPNKDKAHPWQPDDGKEKCVKVWVNELRMADFENSGGWAAQSRVQATLADFATVSLAGQISTPGFGGIEQRVSERQRETIRQVDAATSIQLGKFFGKNVGLQFPLFLGFSEGIIDPQFDPLNPDIEFDQSISDISAEEQQQRIKDARDITVRRSMNFTNVRLSPKKRSTNQYPWDIKNFGFTYAYNELYRRDIQTEYNTTRTYNGALNYTYQTNMKPFTPFRNNKFLRSSPWFRVIRDININPLPKQVAFTTNIDRTYSESKARDITGNALIIPQFTKTFTWDRNYDLNWNIMEGLRLNYNANNQGLIKEPGDLKADKTLYPDEFEMNRDSVLNSFANFGENNHFLQSTNLTYTWPFKKIPVLSFVNLTTKYQATYDWQRAPLSQDSLGNTIQNSRNIAWNGSFNMQNLYNKVPYFKKVNQKSRSNSRRGSSNLSKSKTLDGEKGNKDGKGDDKGDKSKKSKKKDPNALTFADGLAKILMSLQNVTFSYSTIDGQLLPGYKPQSEYFGMTNGFTTPGIGFVFGGEQERDFFGRATDNDFAVTSAKNGWLVGPTSRYINSQRTTNHSKNFNTRATFEPFKGIRIELTANYLYSENMNENFIWDDSLGSYQNFNTMRVGNYNYSFNSIRTAFVKDDTNGNSKLFTQLLENRKTASTLLQQQNPYASLATDSAGFYDGYGASQQQVVMASFIAAYSGKNLTQKTLNPLSALPNLNWRVTIDGLNRMPAIRKIFRSIVFSHAYNSTFTVASFNTDLEAVIDENGNGQTRDESGNIRPEQQIMTVSITEQFNPLFKVDATWQNSLITKVEYRSNRNISLSLANNQITELKGTEITIGTGYRFQNVKFPIKIGKKTPISDINARLDISFRDNKTIIRKIDQNQNQLTAGQKYIAIKGSADYVLNKQFTLRFYYDRVMTNPYISTSFPTMNQNVGFAIRVNLFQ
ncbi:MAG: cell surface protein SprA [Flavobacteriales bacterium]